MAPDGTGARAILALTLAGDKGMRLVVELDTSVKIRDHQAGKRQKVSTNAIINGLIINVDALRDGRKYELDGSL